ncbi:hypothetical protein EVG20_g6814 [Dentipellis fragilis]|uniref:Autophagy-related protein 27 n=1 Tax=Dentipellis fragilis TaxID=205917 RepID=A0A4Y9YJZ1_9AGAM|nr:hypothetical protein EVG20_g6814 [Dentipellis fragilis]
MVAGMKSFTLGAVPSFALLFLSLLHAVAAAETSSNASSSAEPTSSTSPHSSSSPPLSSSPPSSSASISASANVSSTAPASANASSTGLPSPVAPPPTIPGKLPNSFPQNYSNIPSEGDFSPDWQGYFQVNQGLPNISFPLSRNFAGNLPVGRANHPNNTLFFWGFETTMGSLTVPAAQQQLSPWMIWLGGGGGPGSSSLFTAMTGNGPMLLHNDFSITQNSMSWSNLLDIFWVDQPVGSGFSTVDSDGYVKNEDDVAADFLGFLTNLVKVFPSLADRPLILAGEDYAGIFIPYIAQALFSSSSPPVNLQKIAIGNGLMGGFSIIPNLATISILESFPQLIKFSQDTFQSFRTQQQLCGLDVNLTYPQQSPLPPIQSTPRKSSFWTNVPKEAKIVGVLDRRGMPPSPEDSRSRLIGRQSPLTGSLDPFYQCALFDEMIDYAANNSFPWAPGNFNPWNVPDLVNPQPSLDAGPYFNSDQVRGALHAPTSKNWTSVAAYPFGSTTNISSSANVFGDSSAEPITFFNDFVSTAAAHNVEFILFTGANNAIANHRGLEILIQNATFGGTRGFTRKPSTPWADDDGNVAGIVHTERGITYGLFDGVGHLIPHFSPGAAYVFLRDFIVNANETGSITTDSKSNTVVLGGEDPSIADDVPRIATEIFLGASSTQSTFAAPSATVAAWQSFLGTVPNLSGTTDAASAAPATVNSLLASMSAVVLAALTVVQSGAQVQQELEGSFLSNKHSAIASDSKLKTCLTPYVVSELNVRSAISLRAQLTTDYPLAAQALKSLSTCIKLNTIRGTAEGHNDSDAVREHHLAQTAIMHALSSILLAAGLASTLVPASIAADSAGGTGRALKSLVKDCQFAIGDYKFNLCPLFEQQDALQQTIVFDTQTPPTVTKTVYKLNLDGPLPKNEKLPDHEQCPDGTWFSLFLSLSVCTYRMHAGINRRPEHEDEDPRIVQVVPVVGSQSASGDSSKSSSGSGVGITAAMRKSDGKTHPYLQIRMDGGHYVDKPQSALLVFGCNHKLEEPTKPSHLWNWNGTHVFTWMTKHACAHAHAADSAPDDPPADAPPNDELIETPPERYWTSKHSLTTILLCTVAVLFGFGYTLIHPPAPLRRRMAPVIRRLRRSRFSSAVGENKLLRWAQEDLALAGFDEEDEMVNARGSDDIEGWDEQIPLKPSPKSPAVANYGTALHGL